MTTRTVGGDPQSVTNYATIQEQSTPPITTTLLKLLPAIMTKISQSIRALLYSARTETSRDPTLGQQKANSMAR